MLVGNPTRTSLLRLPSDFIWINGNSKGRLRAIGVLEHIILSHHGVPEFGAAKIPATPEAIMVSILDNLDAKMNMSLAAARPDHALPDGGNFTEKLWALDTKLYRPDPLSER